jgi:riboflavin kinase/FMN adenylyltransferase
VVTVDPLQDGGEVVSSSLVRAALIGGELERANRLLGHLFFVDAWVEHSDSVDRSAGHPSAHLAITPGKCLPARGVYATWLKVRGRWHMAATNVGYGPTFGHDRLAVESLLLDFEGDLYRQKVRAAFVARLREERRFGGVEELGAQIARDAEQAQAVLGERGAPSGL